jgi:hypothetical protein
MTRILRSDAEAYDASLPAIKPRRRDLPKAARP